MYKCSQQQKRKQTLKLSMYFILDRNGQIKSTQLDHRIVNLIHQKYATNFRFKNSKDKSTSNSQCCLKQIISTGSIHLMNRYQSTVMQNFVFGIVNEALLQ